MARAFESKSKDFFISYTGVDKPWAEWIAWQLEDAEYSAVIQAWDFAAGSDFVLEMDQATKDTERTIVVLSPDYLKGLYTQPEWAAALGQDPTGSDRKLVPVLVRQCQIEGLLRQRVHIDLVDLDESEAKQRLLDGVQRTRAKPETPPGYPGVQSPDTRQKPRYPGALPQIWNVPFLRNPSFTGRESLLTRLRESLHVPDAGSRIQVLSGLGGVGKTHLAAEFAYQHAADYSVVWFVRAETRDTLLSDYADLAEPLGLPQKDPTDQMLVVSAVRRWLEQNMDWLLIFDNAQEAKDLREIIPRSRTGHIVITSRNPNWAGIAQTIEIPTFERSESLTFLRERIGHTDADANMLAKVLDDLPLALEQAGAYIVETGMPVSAYLRLLEKHHGTLLRWHRPSAEYSLSVAETWRLSFERLQESCPDATQLLKLLAYLAPEDIPRDLLGAIPNVAPGLGTSLQDVLAVNEAVRSLRQFSLVQTTPDRLSLHRLVQTVVRDWLSSAEAKQYAEAAVSLVDDKFRFDLKDAGTWPLVKRLLPHARAVADHAEALQVGQDRLSLLLTYMGLFLSSQAQFNESRQSHERALRITEAVYGPDHTEVAAVLSNLGVVLRKVGDLREARGHFERALRIRETAYGPHHPQVAAVVSSLGNLLMELDDLTGAKEGDERALRIMEAVYGPDHPEVAGYVNSLGVLLLESGNLRGAKEHLERALRIMESVFGRDHHEVARVLNNLGGVLLRRNDFTGAKEHFERALRIREATYGPDHHEVAITVENLGGLLLESGDLTGAKEHFERALRIRESIYGPDHTEVARVVSSLGATRAKSGNLTGAKEHFERALRIRESIYGPDHTEVAAVLSHLSAVLWKLGDPRGAKEHLERVLRIMESVYGPNHPEVAVTANNLGVLILESSDPTGAKEHFERALRIMESVYGSDHPEVAGVVNNTAAAGAESGDLTGAKEHHKRVSVWRSIYGLDHIKVACLLGRLRRLYGPGGGNEGRPTGAKD